MVLTQFLFLPSLVTTSFYHVFPLEVKTVTLLEHAQFLESLRVTINIRKVFDWGLINRHLESGLYRIGIMGRIPCYLSFIIQLKAKVIHPFTSTLINCCCTS